MKPIVIFQQVKPSGPRVEALLGDGPAIASANGGWTTTARPKRKSMTTWAGYDPYTMSILIVLDGWVKNSHVEDGIEQLRRMMRVPTRATGAPPVIRVIGPVPMSSLRWVIQGITPAEEIRRETDGARLRAFMTVELLEYVPAEVLTVDTPSPAKAAQERNPEKGSTRTYVVKKGDTLWEIAQEFLGAGTRWPEIATMNDIRDPRRLSVGARLRIP